MRKFLVIYALLLTLACAYLGVRYVNLVFEAANAELLMDYFLERKSAALKSRPKVAAQVLQDILNFYPSGTKISHGSLVDRIVERARTSAAGDIGGYLREKTRKDFGEDPRAWIENLHDHE
jgi:hypothetical protein